MIVIIVAVVYFITDILKGHGGYQPKGNGKIGTPPQGGSGVPRKEGYEFSRPDGINPFIGIQMPKPIRPQPGKNISPDDWEWAMKQFNDINPKKIIIPKSNPEHKIRTMKLRTSKEQMRGRKKIMPDLGSLPDPDPNGYVGLKEEGRKPIQPLPPPNPEVITSLH